MTIRTRLRRAYSAIGARLFGGGVQQRGYQAAEHAALVAWALGRVSQNDVLMLGLSALRERSRDFCKNNGEAAGFLRDMESDIVGAEGVIVQSRIRFAASDRVRDSINDTIEAAYRRYSSWGQTTTCGRHSRASLARLVIRTVCQDGEFFAYYREGMGADGLLVRPFDPALVDDTFNRVPSPGVNGVDMGVEYDAEDRVVAYHVLESITTRRRRAVPASEILHVFVPMWAGQRRGVPAFTPVLMDAKVTADYIEAELMQTRLGAVNGVFFETDKDTAPLPQSLGADNKILPVEWDAQPAFGRVLPPGVTAKSHAPTHPNPNSVGFIAAIKQGMSRGVGRSYASYTGDLSKVNYSSMRIDRLRELDFNRLMQTFLLDQFERPLFERWVGIARRTGALFLPTTVSTPQIMAAARFQTRGWAYTDPVKDANAAAILLALGLTTRSREAAKLGLDFYDLVEERKEENAWAAQHEVLLSNGPSSLVALAGAAEALDTDSDPDIDDTDEDAPAGRGIIRAA